MMKKFLILLCLVSPFLWSGKVSAQTIMRTGSLLEEARENLKKGDYKRAVALADSVARHSSNTLSKIEATDILTKAYPELGLIHKASEAFGAGLDIFRDDDSFGPADSLASNPDYSRFLFNYARFLLSTGDYDGCLETLADVSFPPLSEELTKAEGLRASALMRKGNHAEAVSLLDNAIGSYEGADPESHPTLPVLLQNRGFLYLLTKNFPAAESDLERAVKGLEGKNAEIARANLALAMAGNGDFGRATETINVALRNLKALAGVEDADYIIALRKKGEILNMEGKKREALDIFREFFTLEKERLTALLPTMSGNMRLNFWTMEKPLLSKCFLVAEENPGFSMDVALMRRETSLLGSGDMEKRLRRLAIDHKDVAASLKKGEAAVALVSFPDEKENTVYGAITVDHNGNCRYASLFPEELIYTDYGNHGSIYECLLSEDPRDKNTLYADVNLADMIWQPVLSAIPTDVTTLYFAPEGVFHLWGIENMPFSGREKYKLVRRFSLSDIGARNRRNPREMNVVMAGGLDYDDIAVAESGGYFSYLPGTLDEVNACRLIMPGTNMLTSLTEEEIKNSSQKFDVLHLATHGYALDCGLSASPLQADSLGYDLTMLRSGVALTGANAMGAPEGKEDGILTAREICDLDLSGADLVVLSACQTAKGVISDESASGLIRALKIAGANTIVATLWEVDDRSAAIFMSHLYKALADGFSKQEAIQQARYFTANHTLERRKKRFDPVSMARKPSGDTISYQPYSSPWYWAPFIIIDP